MRKHINEILEIKRRINAYQTSAASLSISALKWPGGMLSLMQSVSRCRNQIYYWLSLTVPIARCEAPTQSKHINRGASTRARELFECRELSR